MFLRMYPRLRVNRTRVSKYVIIVLIINTVESPTSILKTLDINLSLIFIIEVLLYLHKVLLTIYSDWLCALYRCR